MKADGGAGAGKKHTLLLISNFNYNIQTLIN